MSAAREISLAPTASFAEAPWQELYRLVQSQVSRSRTLSPEEHDDIVQNVFLALVQHRGATESPEELRGLAVTIAKRTALNWLRNLYRPVNRHRKPWREHFAETVCAPPTNEFERDIKEAMRLMADDTRAAFQGVVFERWTQEKAATQLGCSRATIRRLLAEADDFLRRLWGIDVNE